MKEYRNFLTDIALEDFIGNELIARDKSGDEQIIIIDVANPVPSGGHINGIGGFFSASGDIIIKLLRPVGKDYIVTYNKKLQVTIDNPDKKFVDFDKPIISKKGDIMAYYFPGPVIVPYNSDHGVNTYSKMRSDKYKNGDRVPADDIFDADQIKRKYSLSYYGVFYSRVDN